LCKVRQIGLLVAELLADFSVAAEIFQHIRMSAQLEAVHRRVAGDAPGPLVVVDDESRRAGEELVQAPAVMTTSIQEQRRALEAVQDRRKVVSFFQPFLGCQRAGSAGNGQALHLGANPFVLSVRQTKRKSPLRWRRTMA
jgi:hypothetical protein